MTLIQQEKKVPLSRILKQTEWPSYRKELELMQKYAGVLMAHRMMPELIQHAFVLNFILERYTRHSKILCVGSVGDVTLCVLKQLGYNAGEVDPKINWTFESFAPNAIDRYDCIYAIDVLEHIEDEIGMLKAMNSILIPGGIGIIVCKFKSSWASGDSVKTDWRKKLLENDVRLYTKGALIFRARKAGLKLDKPDWSGNDEELDLTPRHVPHTFASMIWQKN